MCSKIRQNLAQNLFNVINGKHYQGQYQDFLTYFTFFKPPKSNQVFWRFELPINLNNQPNSDIIQNNHKQFIDNGTLGGLKICSLDYSIYSNDIKGKDYLIEYNFDLKNFIKDTLDSDPTALSFTPIKKNIIIEFSSPNIAKPFHVGHLRSTMIGNCLSNLKTKLGQNVVKMNYLGDWGTQLGKVDVGVKLLKFSDEDLKKDPVSKLYQAYVKGNREAELFTNVYDSVKQTFYDLENNKREVSDRWEKYKKWTIEELSRVYEMLGVTFDEYCWESDYNKNKADEMLQILKNKCALATDNMGRQVVKLDNNEIPLVKSDGTTLYLLRDLMALAHRSKKHNFDEMYYVVENGQNLHFSTLFRLGQDLELSRGKLEHVKFGRIHGMSSRKGKVTFLTDILVEAQERAAEAQLKSRNTKAALDDAETPRVLGVSAVVINDLKQRRKKDYEFSWDKALQIKGDTGIHIQYCYSRLHSLEDNCNIKAATDCDPESLLEPEAVNLIFEIARFEEVLLKADAELEPCVIVAYLFKLVKSCNVAFCKLNVKNSEEHVGSQRLLMFQKCKEIIEDGMRILGVKTVKQM